MCFFFRMLQEPLLEGGEEEDKDRGRESRRKWVLDKNISVSLLEIPSLFLQCDWDFQRKWHRLMLNIRMLSASDEGTKTFSDVDTSCLFWSCVCLTWMWRHIGLRTEVLKDKFWELNHIRNRGSISSVWVYSSGTFTTEVQEWAESVTSGQTLGGRWCKPIKSLKRHSGENFKSRTNATNLDRPWEEGNANQSIHWKDTEWRKVKQMQLIWTDFGLGGRWCNQQHHHFVFSI